MFYEIEISKSNATDSIRKQMIRSLIGSSRNHKRGMIEKFNNSYGYKKVSWDMTTQYPKMLKPAVDTPDEYTTPHSLLLSGLWASFDDNGIVKFIVEDGIEYHPDYNYTYEKSRIAHQFTDFLTKVYPDFDINLFVRDGKFEYSDKEFLKSFFYMNLACEDDTYVTIECSSGEQMSDEDCKDIRSVCAGLNDFKWHVESFFCETCKQHHKEAPYHNEIVFDR